MQVTTHGVLTRTVRDSALYYAEVEKRFRNPRLDPVGHVISPPTRRLRVAAIIDSPTGVRSTP